MYFGRQVLQETPRYHSILSQVRRVSALILDKAHHERVVPPGEGSNVLALRVVGAKI